MNDPHVLRYQRFFPPELTEPVVEPETTWLPTATGTTLHLFRHPAATDAPAASVIVFHGAGGHGRLLACIGVGAQRLGCSAVAPDLPGYGHTVVADRGAITYQDWVDAGIAVVKSEARMGRPVILVGASMGGRLAVDVAHATGDLVTEVVATCLLDPRLPEVRRAAGRHPALASAFPALTLVPEFTDRIRVPIRWLAPIRTIANDPALAAACASDPLGAGGRVPLGFLRSWFEYDPGYEPETFDACPVTLTHPGDDRWTPLALSQAWFDRLQVERRLVVLEGCGHFPVEEPGVTQLFEALNDVVARAGDRSARPAATIG